MNKQFLFIVSMLCDDSCYKVLQLVLSPLNCHIVVFLEVNKHFLLFVLYTSNHFWTKNSSLLSNKTDLILWK